jgi:hypothetical protein
VDDPEDHTRDEANYGYSPLPPESLVEVVLDLYPGHTDSPIGRASHRADYRAARASYDHCHCHVTRA